MTTAAVNINTEEFATDLEEVTNEANYGITESMSRFQLEQHFANSKEIVYKNLTLGVMDWGDGRFDVLTPADNENGFTTLNPTPYTTACDAVSFAINHLLEYDVSRNPDGTKIEVITTNSKKKNSKPKEPKYDGPRTVKVFGREIYIEEDSKSSWEDIRVKLVTEYNFPNFKKNKVFFDFDESTGTLEVLLKFDTKG